MGAMRAAFSAVEAASSKQSVMLKAVERKTEATLQATLAAVAAGEGDNAEVGAVRSMPSAGMPQSAVFTDPSVPAANGFGALENALCPVTAPDKWKGTPGQRRPPMPQTSYGSFGSLGGTAFTPRELARLQDEQLTAVAEALRTPPTTINGLTLSASCFPKSWSGREAVAVREGGYVPIRPGLDSVLATRRPSAPAGPGTPRSTTPQRLASITGTFEMKMQSLGTPSGLPVVVHSSAHQGYVLGQAKLGKQGRGLRLRSSTSNAAELGTPAGGTFPGSQSTLLPPVWSTCSVATLVPSLPTEPTSQEILPHAIHLSQPVTPRAGVLRSPRTGSRERPAPPPGGYYATMPSTAPMRGQTANFRFALRTPLQQQVFSGRVV